MKTFTPAHPPQWPLKFLRFFLREEYIEEIEGDMEELFHDYLERFSPSKARRLYTLEVLKLIRPNLLKNAALFRRGSPLPMFQNYVKVSARGLVKQPLNSFINVFGLAAAISICVFAYGFARWTFNRDQFHQNKDVVFLVTSFADQEGYLQQYGTTPRPLAEQLKQDFSQIRSICRIEDRPVIIKAGDNLFHERVRFTDPAFLQVFTFPLKWGISSGLNDLNSIILSEPMSEKYFGTENPVGQDLLVRLDKNHAKLFRVVGVAERFPSARSLDFNFLVHLDNLKTLDPGYEAGDWAKSTQATLVQVGNPQDVTAIREQMGRYTDLQNQAAADGVHIRSFQFEALATLHLRSGKIRDSVFRGGSDENIVSIVFLSAICLLMLALACFNYINIAIATAVRRLKELGIRKTIGATRRVIIGQFLTENLVITFFALFIGVALGRFVVIPWFEGLWNFSMDFRFADPLLWLFLPSVLLFTGLASGIYPAVYISRFETVTILKGSAKFGGRNPLTRTLLATQLVFACIFITSAVMFTRNTNFLSHRGWGYANREVVYAVAPDALAFEQLKTVMARDPQVLSLAGSSDHIGKKHRPVTLKFPDRELSADLLEVDAKYLETMGVTLSSGRHFHEGDNADRQSVIINETMVRNMGWSKPVGESFRIDSVKYDVVGVVSEFYSYSFDQVLRPALFRLADPAECRYLSLRVSSMDVYDRLRKAWLQLNPEVPFQGGYQEDVWGNYYTEIGIHGHVWRVFASVAVLLASLGLYGLVSLNASGRVKEFSIRKVLGATISSISLLMLRQYALLFGVALAVGIPLSYYAIRFVLDFAYPVHIPVTPWSVGLAALLLVCVLVATVGTQVLGVFRRNPVKGLTIE